ncbi:MAG TPA: ABC transporter permease [Rhizomicrobium sp.]|jgi:putative ABC transport system permease protein|nr:ABC transporter permease [Rhizomicrobium sp.]
MTFLRSCLAAIQVNLAGLKQRIWPALVVVAGVACVVGVLLSMLSVTVGLSQVWQRAGSPDRAIILPASAQDESDGNVSRSEVEIIKNAPGIAHDAESRAIADSEMLTYLDARRRAKGRHGFILLRTFGPMGLTVRPEFRIVAGRMFRPGNREMIVGAEAPGQFLGVGLGDKVEMPDGPWPVVGVFRNNDDVVQSELVADSDTVMAAMRSPNFSSVIVRLAGPDGLAALKRAVTTNPSLSVTVERQSDYYNRRAAEFSDANDALVYGVSLLLGLGALLAAVNILYSAVAARRSEIATLRALGFGPAAVALAVAVEALLLSLAGAVVGTTVAFGLFDDVQDVWGENVFYETVSPAMVALGLGWAFLIGFLGGVLPAIHAARLSIVDGLRAS